MPNITLTESAPVVVRYEYPDGFRDALNFASQAERGTWTPAMIEAECERRHNNWIAAIAAPRPEPTAEQIAAQVDALVEQQRTLQDQIIALTPDNVLRPILEGQAALIAEQIAALNAAVLAEAAGRG